MKTELKIKLDEVIKNIDEISEAYSISPREEITQIKKTLQVMSEFMKIIEEGES